MREQLGKSNFYFQNSGSQIWFEWDKTESGVECFVNILEFMNVDKEEWISLIGNRQDELSLIKNNLKEIESEQNLELFDARIRSILEDLKKEMAQINLKKLSKINEIVKLVTTPKNIPMYMTDKEVQNIGLLHEEVVDVMKDVQS